MKNFIIITFNFTLLTFNLFAQWQPDIRLTNDTAVSYTSQNNAWCIAASGNVVHAVWYDQRDGNDEIYYKRSTDGGVIWGADTRLTNNSAQSWNPSVTVSGSVMHVVWYDGRDGNNEIYYKRSTDGGISWGADARLTNNSAISKNPSLSVFGPVVHVAWLDNRDGNTEIYYKRSTDGGLSWGADTRLTNNSAQSWNPSVTVSGSSPSANVHVVWYDGRDGNEEIYYKRSTDGGVSWGADARLTNNPAYSYNPSVSASGPAAVHIVWHDYRDGANPEIYYKRSTDGGVSWGADSRLTNNPADSYDPSIFVSGPVVHVVWYDFRDGNFEIYYKRSTDGGVSWGADTRLTNNSAQSWYPSVTVSGSSPSANVHVVWSDTRDGNWEIYYKRDPTGNLVGIININSELPKEFSLSQNYPNPFNPTTKIRFAIPPLNLPLSGGDGEGVLLKIYDMLGREVATLVNEQLTPGTYEVDWDGANYPSGVYYYKIVAGDYAETRKMVLIK